jgi:hypothetical protein
MLPTRRRRAGGGAFNQNCERRVPLRQGECGIAQEGIAGYFVDRALDEARAVSWRIQAPCR